VKKSKKWTRVERFERLWLVLSAQKISSFPKRKKSSSLSREQDTRKIRTLEKRRR